MTDDVRSVMIEINQLKTNRVELNLELIPHRGKNKVAPSRCRELDQICSSCRSLNLQVTVRLGGHDSCSLLTNTLS